MVERFIYTEDVAGSSPAPPTVIPHFDLIYLIATVGYAGIFAMVFAESGLFFAFFLPADTLLFTAGLLASTDLLDIRILLLGIPIAAILGDSAGYWFGSFVGPKLFTKEESLFFHPAHVRRAERFYAKYGPRALVLARFLPVVRTFVPILAGVAHMHYRTFLIYNIAGGLLWGVGMTLLGYLLGQTFPQVEEYLLPVILLIVILSFAPIGWELWRERRTR